ncbi:MAG TPA: hypothetical protein VMW36_05410 [Patescibacteria group bacterium]|nr:hypothetical protein [Patescibacteria group bacterium]
MTEFKKGDLVEVEVHWHPLFGSPSVDLVGAKWVSGIYLGLDPERSTVHLVYIQGFRTLSIFFDDLIRKA